MNQSEYKRDIESLKALSREGELSPLRQEVLKSQLMSRLSREAEDAAQVPARFLWAERRTSLLYAIVPAFLVFMLMGGTVFASYGALPGETLYPVKRLTEQVEFTLAPTEQAKAEVQAKHAVERLDELTALEIKSEDKATNTTEVRTMIEPQVVAPQGVPEVPTQPQPTEPVEPVQTESSAPIPSEPAAVNDWTAGNERQQQARAEARAELETALNALNKVRVKLEAKGKKEAATSIQNTMQNLTQRATPTFKVEVESEDHGKVRVKFPKLPTQQDWWNRDRDNNQGDSFDGSQDDSIRETSREQRSDESQSSEDSSADVSNGSTTIEDPSPTGINGEVKSNGETETWHWYIRGDSRRGSDQEED